MKEQDPFTDSSPEFKDTTLNNSIQIDECILNMKREDIITPQKCLKALKTRRGYLVPKARRNFAR